MKNLKFLQVSIDFSANLLRVSLASGAIPPTPANPYSQSFLNFSLNFSEYFDKIIRTSKDC